MLKLPLCLLLFRCIGLTDRTLVVRKSLDLDELVGWHGGEHLVS